MTGPNDRKRSLWDEDAPEPVESTPPEDVVDPEDWGGPLLGDIDDSPVLEPRWLVEPPPEVEEK